MLQAVISQHVMHMPCPARDAASYCKIQVHDWRFDNQRTVPVGAILLELFNMRCGKLSLGLIKKARNCGLSLREQIRMSLERYPSQTHGLHLRNIEVKRPAT